MTNPLACPATLEDGSTCESTLWTDYEACSETLRVHIHVDDPEAPNGDEKSVHYSTDDSEGWHCENDHAPPADLNDKLNELRAEIDFIQ